MQGQKTIFSRATDNWATPQWLFDELDQEFHFTLDVCADEINAKCKTFFSKVQDLLQQSARPSSAKCKTGFSKSGMELSGAILHMGGKSSNGSRRPVKLLLEATPW